TPKQWAIRRTHILANMQEVMGPLPDVARRIPLDIQITEVAHCHYGVRKKLTYAAEVGDRVPAYLLIPTAPQRNLPAVLCLHQTIWIGKEEPVGYGKNPNLHIAIHLVERGYVVLVPDYPSFGEYRYDFAKSKYQSGSMKAVWNNMRAIDLLQSLPEVDPK